jgi:hypothetical protein
LGGKKIWKVKEKKGENIKENARQGKEKGIKLEEIRSKRVK